MWTFASPPPESAAIEGGCPAWALDDPDISRVMGAADLIEFRGALKPEEQSYMDACTCPPWTSDMLNADLAARFEVCRFAEAVADKQVAVWAAWRDSEATAHEKFTGHQGAEIHDENDS